MNDNQILFSGEMQLCAWGESMQSGAWVKMWVHPEDLEAFKLMKARTGKHAGQRLGVCIVQIDDDEAVKQHAPAPTPAPVKGPTIRMGDMGRTAVMWCERPSFRQWARESTGLPIADKNDAKEFILDECGVTAQFGQEASRKHLDLHEFGRPFLDRIFYPYSAWAQAHGIDLTKKE